MKRTILTAGVIFLVFSSQAIWVTFSPVTTSVAKDLGVSVKYVGFLAVLYPFLFLVLTFPSGILLDRNFKMWLTIGGLLTFLSGVGRLIYFDFWWFFFCQVLAGIGQPLLLNSFVPFSTKIYPERKTDLISLLSLSMYIGAVFALSSGVKLYDVGGIRALILPSSLISLFGFIFLFIGRDLLSSEKVLSHKSSTSHLSSLLERKDLWLIGSTLGLGVASFDNLATWLQPALKNEGLEKIAGTSVAIAIVMGLIGIGIIPKKVSEKNIRTIYLRAIIPVIGIFFLILAIKVEKSILMFALAVSGFLMIPAYVIIMDWIGKFYAKDVQGSATGFVGLVSRCISVVLISAGSNFISSSKVYFTFLLFPIIIAFLITLFIPNDKKLTPVKELEI